MFSSTRILTALLSRFIPAETLELYDGLDWEEAIAVFQSDTVEYPVYYTSQNFHGIEGGYLNKIAPITYDFVTAIATPPNEVKIRQTLMAAIQGKPKRILDLGCGTGSGTLMLAERFPHADIIGLDLSPYMLVMANRKAKGQGNIQWCHGLAEQTGLEAEGFDVISISMLFHEMPPHMALKVLQECDRLLKPQGQLLILDGHQGKLRQLKWVTEVFREPYSFQYAQDDICQRLGEHRLCIQDHRAVGWINQLTVAQKI